MVLIGAADLIPGTEVDEWFVAVVGVLVLITTAAALAHKPPLRQIGRFIGWIFRRLIGEPIAGYLMVHTAIVVRPIVQQEVEAATAPLHASVEELHSCVDQAVTESRRAADAVEAHAVQMGDHVASDSREFEAQREWRDTELRDWQAGVDLALGNIQAGQAPHVPTSE